MICPKCGVAGGLMAYPKIHEYDEGSYVCGACRVMAIAESEVVAHNKRHRPPVGQAPGCLVAPIVGDGDVVVDRVGDREVELVCPVAPRDHELDENWLAFIKLQHGDDIKARTRKRTRSPYRMEPEFRGLFAA